MMNSCELTAAVSTISLAIANHITDDDELALLAAVLVHIGDTLAMISINRSMMENKQKASIPKE